MKARLITKKIIVYKDPADKKSGIPPLFEFRGDFKNIDTKRVKSFGDIKLNYKLN